MKWADTGRYAKTYDRGNKRYFNDEDGNYNEPKERPYERTAKGELFPFDPNTLDADGWKRLGLRDKTISTIQNYLSKGGRFRKPEDIKRIYGLFPDEAERLLPYVTISEAPTERTYTERKDFAEAGNVPTPRPTYTPRTVDINTADTSAFIALPGIGSKLAFRIVNFREKLGGFYSIDQVGETYGLPDSTFQKIRSRLTITTAPFKQIDINKADVNQLRAHPYIKWNVANVIVQYRAAHGNYTSLNDLKKIEIIDEQLFKKISPYLTLQ